MYRTKRLTHGSLSVVLLPTGTVRAMSSAQQDASASFTTAVVINSIVGTVVLLALLLISNRVGYKVYAPRWLAATRSAHPRTPLGRWAHRDATTVPVLLRPPPRGCWAFLRHITLYPADELLAVSGLDALMLTRLAALGAVLFAVITAYGFLVLLPINLTSFAPANFFSVDAFEFTSITHVADGSPALWAHTVSVLLFTALACGLIDALWRYYLPLRYAYLAVAQPARKTALLLRLPPSVTDDASLRQLADSLYPGVVERACLVTPGDELAASVAKRDALVTALSRARSKWAADTAAVVAAAASFDAEKAAASNGKSSRSGCCRRPAMKRSAKRPEPPPRPLGRRHPLRCCPAACGPSLSEPRSDLMALLTEDLAAETAAVSSLRRYGYRDGPRVPSGELNADNKNKGCGGCGCGRSRTHTAGIEAAFRPQTPAAATAGAAATVADVPGDGVATVEGGVAPALAPAGGLPADDVEEVRAPTVALATAATSTPSGSASPQSAAAAGASASATAALEGSSVIGSCPLIDPAVAVAADLDPGVPVDDPEALASRMALRGVYAVASAGFVTFSTLQAVPMCVQATNAMVSGGLRRLVVVPAPEPRDVL